MVTLWIFIAFLLGFAATFLKLPPLVGYLAAGFVLNALGVQGGGGIDDIADMGVLFLLFSIGLKLKLSTLAKPLIWAGATLHMACTVAVIAGFLLLFATAGLAPFAALDPGPMLLVAFALSFSSTVFAVKTLEERGEMTSFHGRVAVGILIMQDILAVLFLTFSTGKLPSPWAAAVIPALFILRPLLMILMDRVGHRELLLLFGIVLVMGFGAGGFELVGLKPDLGALVLGVVVSSHPKADELSKTLLSFKDLFLVGFFLSIGLSGLPTPQAFMAALVLMVVLLPKTALYFALLTRLRMRSRSALLASLSLFNYSEFGLIVAAVGVRNGWIGVEWSIIAAIGLSLSFVLASAANRAPHALAARYRNRIIRFETPAPLPEEQPISPGSAKTAVFGMGRVGRGAYDYMQAHFDGEVVGVDNDEAAVAAHCAAGRRVISGDATDPEFWEKIQHSGQIRLVLLTLPYEANLFAVRRIMASSYAGIIAATAKYEDEMAALETAGVHFVFNFFSDAGIGFAERVCRKMKC